MEQHSGGYPKKIVAERILWKLRCDDNSTGVYDNTTKEIRNPLEWKMCKMWSGCMQGN